MLEVAPQDRVEERFRETERWFERTFLEIWNVSRHTFVPLSPNGRIGYVEVVAEPLAPAAVL